MNKIPKCKSKNIISRQHLKLTKKYSGENKIINLHQSKIINQFDSNKLIRKDSKNSIIASTKQSTISSASSKNSSLASNQNVSIFNIYLIILPYFIFFLCKKVSKKNSLINHSNNSKRTFFSFRKQKLQK